MYDMKNLSKLKALGELAPDAVRAFWAFDRAAFADGAIPLRYKELMAVALALATQCPYCIEDHAGRARKAGASEPELAEAATVAAAMRAGAGVAHATHVVR
jgi:AhpD family alkylhydroperoxidase